jgi:cbb3-type cytochrome c oxidase subunit III
MGRRLPSFVAAIGLLAWAVASAGCGAASASATPSGAQLYRSCVSCHGPSGEGNALIGAPRLAGMPAWYVASQVERFQTGLRGQHPDDVEGLRMRAMSKQMLSKAEVETVATYIAALAPVTNPATLPAPAAATQSAFTLCTTCHGDRGQGNEQVHAPPLAGQDDWYVARQLRKFRSRVRGTAAGDPIGPVMQAMSLTIAPENIDALAAYVHALPHDAH